MSKEQMSKILDYLNQVNPTYGDGWWSPKFVNEVVAGLHEEEPNAFCVHKAVAAVAPELLYGRFDI